VKGLLALGSAGHLTEDGPGRITFRDYVENVWLPSRHVEVSTLAGYRSYLDKHFLPFLGDRPMAEILPSSVQDWVTAAVGSGLSPTSVRKYHVMLHAVFDDDVAALIAATRSLGTPMRRANVRHVDRLLAVTGMRVGEAIAIDRSEVDLGAGYLMVRNAKFGKSRESVLHPSTVDALRQYLQERDRLALAAATASLFVSTAGTRLIYHSVNRTFHRLVRVAGLRPGTALSRPRIHDLRHSLVVRSMLDAYAAEQDGQTQLTLISTYLGHVQPASTYWYLSASPELMAVAGQRLEAHLAGRP